MKVFDSSTWSPGCPERFPKEPEQACDRLRFRCTAKLHATRHIRATRNEQLFRVVLLQGTAVRFRMKLRAFKTKGGPFEQWAPRSELTSGLLHGVAERADSDPSLILSYSRSLPSHVILKQPLSRRAPSAEQRLRP